MYPIAIGAPPQQHSVSEQSANESLIKQYDRSAVYDALYSRGYQVHSLNFSLSGPLIDFISTQPSVASVLDVGCSHGFAVSRLWSLGLKASGIDMSNVAVALAREIRGNGSEARCILPREGHPRSCFQQGSAASLPWPDRSFDITMSSDVLEHVPPMLVDVAVAEMSRVTRKLLVLKISNRLERQTKQFLAIQQLPNLTTPKALHESVANSSWWIAKFDKHGFVLKTKLPTSKRLCCAFVLAAKASHPGFLLPRAHQRHL